MIIYLILFKLSCVCLTTADEIFTAMTDMAQLLKVEDVLITNLKTFITDQESKLNSIQKYDFNKNIFSK